MPRSKRFKEVKAKVDPKKIYTKEEAVELIKQTATTKFDGSVEVHLHLGIDPSQSDQQVRGTVSLPHGSGKTRRVAAFVGTNKEKEAKEAGADIVGGEELIEEIAQKGKIDFDIAVATPDMMPKLAKVARILGPKGLMPNPKTDTVGPNVKQMVEDMRGGKVSFKNDDTSNVHQIIGKASFEAPKLLENLNAFIEAVQRLKPSSSKGIYIKKAVLASSMGPGVQFQV